MFLNYFHFIEFLQNKKILYLIIINIIIAFIIGLFLFLFLIAFKFKRNNFLDTFFSDVLKILIPFFSIYFFGQIFNSLLSANRCINNYAFYDLSLKCSEGLLFFLQQILAFIAIICLFIISSFVVSIYYIPIFIKGNNILKKPLHPCSF